MMKFKVKISYATIAVLAAILFALLALIFSIVSNNYGGSDGAAYGVTAIGSVIAYCVVAIVCAAASFVLDCMFGSKLFSIIADVLRFAAAALLIVGFTVMISERQLLMGYIWFSDLESGNDMAVSALYTALVAWIFYFLGIVACAVSLFGSFCRKK